MTIEMNNEETVLRLENAFRDYFARGVYAQGRADYYAVRLDNVSKDACTFDLIITFRAGEKYCCAESGCHFGVWGASEWSAIRKHLDRMGLGMLKPLTVRRLCIKIEGGVLLGMKFPGDTSQLQRQDEYSYENGPFSEASPERLDTR